MDDFARSYVHIAHLISLSSSPFALSSTTYLALRRHTHIRPRSRRILGPPQTRHRLGLRVKRNGGFTIKGVDAAACDGLLVAGEGEHWEGDGYLSC